MTAPCDYSVITLDEARRQHERFLGARARLLRAAQISRRQRCIELGAGWGFAAVELAERSGRRVTAVDRDASCVNYMRQRHADYVDAIQAEIGTSTLPAGAYDLVFAQFAFLWFAKLEVVIQQVRSLLAPGGVLVALEPDFGGMIHWPSDLDLQAIWSQGLQRAGAEPLIGRKLAVALSSIGFETRVLLNDRLEAYDHTLLETLLALPLDLDIRTRLQAWDAQPDEVPRLCHLPLFMIVADRR